MTRLIALALIVMITACARQPLQPVTDWRGHEAAAQSLQHWQLSGKLGVRLPDDSGSARLRWRQSPDDYRIDLSGPFGQGRVIIESTETGVRLRQGGEPPVEADSAETLMWQTTGWQIPVAELTYWVRGIPAPDSRHRVLERTPQGLLKTLRQSGWTLHYSDYATSGQLPLPGRIIAERQDTRLTLIIYDWSLPQP